MQVHYTFEIFMEMIKQFINLRFSYLHVQVQDVFI